MAISTFAPLPALDAVIEPEFPEKLPKEIREALGDMLVSRVWKDWLTTINTRLDQSPASAATPVSLTGQVASISTTALPISSVAQGVYRVAWYARCTQAATVSSSLTVTLTTTDDSNTVSQSSAAMTSNSTGLPASGVFLAYCDRGSLLSYSTTYASVGATPMIYRIIFVVEALASV